MVYAVNEKYKTCLVCDTPITHYIDSPTSNVDGHCPNGCTEIEFAEGTIIVNIFIELDLLMKHFKKQYDTMIGINEDREGFSFYAEYFPEKQSDYPDVDKVEKQLKEAVLMIRKQRSM